ncbi:MAG: ATP-binding protein, partial [Thermodesulfobacteriota bacterium]
EGGVLTVEARHTDNGSTAGTEVRVGDTGCGIAESERQKIFDPFYTTRDRGTGLGLAVVNRIINAYGGRLQLESDHGRGSVFTVWLPVRRTEALAAGHERGGRGNGQNPRVG